MTDTFYTLLTTTGLAKLTNAQITQTKVNLSHAAIGDGNGGYYEPNESMTALRKEVWRGGTSRVETAPDNPNWIEIEFTIPANVGGFYIREIGIFDDTGTLIVVGKYPETYKPTVDFGSTKDLNIKVIIELNNTSSVELKIDPNIIVASRKYVDDKVAGALGNIDTDLSELQQQVATHLDETDNPHSVTKEQVGLGSVLNYGVATQAEAEAGTSASKYMTPQRTKQAIDKTTGALSSLQTTAKGNLVAAINEVKQDGNNVKRNTVDALLSVDDSLPITNNSSWTNVINAIGDISTGRKWATGTAPIGAEDLVCELLATTSNVTKNRIQVSGLDFLPSVVIIQFSGSGVVGGYQTTVVNTAYTHTNGAIPVMLNAAYKLKGDIKIVEGGFTLPMHGVTNNVGQNATWLALE